MTSSNPPKTITKVIHNHYSIDKEGFSKLHSITLEYSDDTKEEGKRVTFTEIACNRCYRAATNFYIDIFPAVFTVKAKFAEVKSFRGLPKRNYLYSRGT